MPPDYQQALQSIAKRIEALEVVGQQVLFLKETAETADSRLREIVARNETLAQAIQKMGDSFIQSQETFASMLQRQRADNQNAMAQQEERNQNAMAQQEERWRTAFQRIENDYIRSHERIVEEIMSRIGGVFIRGGWETASKYLVPAAISLVVIGVGWAYHLIFK